MGLENFRKNLRYLRKKAGFSQPYIAEKLGKKSYTTIQKWETGDAEPSLKDVQILAIIYDVDIDSFVKSDLEYESHQLHIQPQYHSNPEEEVLLADFRKLNTAGRSIAAATIKSLATNPEYTEKENATSA